MIDRQKVEVILRRRFPGATWEQIAVATNAIMGLDEEWQEVEYQDAATLVQEIDQGAQVRILRRTGHAPTAVSARDPAEAEGKASEPVPTTAKIFIYYSEGLAIKPLVS